MNMASMRSFSRCCAVLALVAAFSAHTVRAQNDDKKPVPLDAEQKAIVEQTLDKIIADIMAVKGKYPELAHFGEKPWFTRASGEFRYEYNIKPPVSGGDNSVAKVLPRGCGMYFSLASVFTPRSKWENFYAYRSGGGARAGIWHNFSITTENPGKGVDEALMKIIDGNLGGIFDKLAAEYVIRKNTKSQDTISVMDALADKAEDVGLSAAVVLNNRKLTAKELERLREGYLQGKYPARWGFYLVLELLKKQDGDHFPDFCLAMTKLLQENEKKGQDTFMPTLFMSGPASNSRVARESILEMLAAKGGKADSRLVSTLLYILKEDSVLRNRLGALDSFWEFPEAQMKEGIVAGLENSYFSVRVEAANLVVKYHVEGVEKELTALLASPSSKVRAAAKDAVTKLGLKDVDLNPKRAMPEGVSRIADALWKSGLRDQDIVRVCADVDNRAFNPLPVKPEQSAMPEGVKVETQILKDQNGKIVKTDTEQYTVTLEDAWRMKQVDAASMEKRAAQFTVGIKKEWMSSILDPTGPFLIAAAMKLNKPEVAQQVYERLCDQYENDDAMLYIGVEGVAWEYTVGALKDFQQGKDEEAKTQFATVIALENQVEPYTYLDQWVKLAHKVTADIERRKGDGIEPGPQFSEEQEDVNYWTKKIPEAPDRIKALVAQLENSGQFRKEQEPSYSYRAQPEAALVKEGDAAVEPLLECVLHDERSTRTVMDDMDHAQLPVRWVVSVRAVAMETIEKILDHRFLDPSNYTDFQLGDSAAVQKIVAEVRKYAAGRQGAAH